MVGGSFWLDGLQISFSMHAAHTCHTHTIGLSARKIQVSLALPGISLTYGVIMADRRETHRICRVSPDYFACK